MNQNILKMFGHKKPKQNINIERHFLTQLEVLAKNKPSTLENQLPLNTSELSIQFAEDGKRARKVVRRSNYRMTGKFPSIKNVRMMHWESHYEKMAFQLLEIAPYVVSYSEQPAIFKFINDDGVTETHFPDILVELLNGRKLFIEIKSEGAKHDLKLDNRTKRLQELVIKKGYRYLVIYPEQIKSYEFLENAEEILWHTRVPVPFPIKEKVKRYLNYEVGVTFGSLTQMLADKQAKAWIYRLLIEGFIVSDLSIKLTEHSTISWVKD